AGSLRPRRLAEPNCRIRSTDPAEQRNPPRLHPLSYKDVAVLVEAGVVWVNEAARLPRLRLAAHLEAIEHLLRPLGVIAEVGDHLVVLAEQRYAGVQVGYQQHVAADVEVGGEGDIVNHA